MRDKEIAYYKMAKILTLIPAVVFVITIICMVIGFIHDYKTQGDVAIIADYIAFLSIFLLPLPCLVISIVATVFAAKAKKAGNIQSRKYFVIGIVEIIVSFLGGVLFWLALIIGGAGV